MARGDRRGARARRRFARPAALHRRQVDGRPDRVARRGAARRRHHAGWSSSAIRCIRRAGPSSGATRTCRTSACRCCSSRARATSSAPPTRSARCCRGSIRARTTFEVQDGDHSFKVRVKITGQEAGRGVHRDLRRRRPAFIRDMRELNVAVTTHGRVLIDEAGDGRRCGCSSASTATRRTPTR